MTTPTIRTTSGKALRRICVFCTLAGIAYASLPAYAALGDDVAAVEQDRVKLQARVLVRRNSNYDVHELSTQVGSTVREFVRRDGKIFAVTWSGGWRPNLRDIMGAHYDRFIAATKGQRRARGPVRIELPGMVVFMGGYLRTFWGRAYLTDQLPDGFSAQELE